MELSRMCGRMETLSKIGQEMSMALKREQLIRRAMTGLRNDLGYKGALIVLKKEDAEELSRPRHAVPIRIGRLGVGTIVVPVDYWTPIDQELLEMFAAHVAVALQNIQFREKIRDIVSLTG